jgi:hypothetical protein
MGDNIKFFSELRLEKSPVNAFVQNSFLNGTAHLRIVNNSLNTNIYSYLNTSGGLSFNLFLIAVHFFNTSVN